ncbi:MAG: lycopene cyclase domain-containing protein [Verrucomicrobiota bacterium]|nr:lycopene cyclase domain-containing protein [Verrucomicrobiota bacterium]
MTYLEFLGYFIGIPLLGSIFWALRKQSLNGTRILGIALICLIALVYTTPWDNYLIRQGVWSYPEGVVLGTIGYVPIEEYGFMMLQSMLGGILWSLTHRKDSQSSLSFSIKGVLPALIIGMIGVYFLSQRSGTYAGLILVWACPPLAVQWGFGSRALWSSIKSWGPLWAMFTLYLCFADAYAISEGIWTITPETRSGLEIGNLPFEEALFFALTNLFVLQGLCLWETWKGKKA